MPDITMCTGEGCPQKKTCYRATATPNEFRQSYFVEPPVDAEGKCAYFWQVKNEVKKFLKAITKKPKKTKAKKRGAK